jgi:hypothetical protein
MKRKKQFVTTLILTGTIGVCAEPLLAQTAPGSGPAGPASPGLTVPNAQPPGPTFPQPEPTMPQTQPGVPGSMPGLPQSNPFPGQPTPGSPQTAPGQTAPLPGQPGTIPEKLDQPNVPNQLDRPGSSTEKQKPEGSRLEGERRSIIPPEPRTTMPAPGQSGATTVPDSTVP